MPHIRALAAADLPAIKEVIASTALFPPEMLDEMTAAHFGGGASEELWLAAEGDGQGPVAVAYVAPERMTAGTANLLLIAVHADRQGQGIGGALLSAAEELVAQRGDRMLLVETSGLAEFGLTRRFYLNHGYGEEARIRDYYQAGEDKIVFRKLLPARA